MVERNYSDLSSSEINIAKTLEELKEASAADIAKKLYPQEPIRPKTSLVSVLLKRLEKKNVVVRSKKIGRKAFYRIKEAKIEEAPEKPKIEPLYETLGLQKDILEALEKLKEAAASDIVPIVFKEEDLRKKTAEISVYLKRMEQKGYVVRVGKEGRKAYYSIREIEEEPVTALKIPKIEEIPEFPPIEIPERPAERRIPRLPRLLFPSIVIIVFVSVYAYFVITPTPTGFLVMQKEQVNASYFLLALSEEKGGYSYSVRNVHADLISNATLELTLPEGSKVNDTGGASLEAVAEGIVLRWSIDSIQTNESKAFSFAADVNGSVKMSANGSLTNLRNESLEPSIELTTEPETYTYQPLNLTPASYISFLSIELSATSKNKEKENKIYVFADIDDKENGNEDLIGLQNFTGNWSGTISANLPDEKYTQPPYLALKSDLPASVAIKKINAVWTKKTSISETASAEVIREVPKETPKENITENITVPTENATEAGRVEQIIQAPAELGQHGVGVIGEFYPSNEIRIESQDYIDSYFDWSFQEINSTHWLAKFTFDDNLKIKVKEIKNEKEKTKKDNKIKEICGSYLSEEMDCKDKAKLDKLKEDLENTTFYPLASLTHKIKFDKETIDIMNENSFYIIFPEGFKTDERANFGFGTTVINTAQGNPFDVEKRNICRTTNKIHVVWKINSTHIGYANSSDGETWSRNYSFYVNTAGSGERVYEPSMDCYGDNISIAIPDANLADLIAMISTNEGTTWTKYSPITAGINRYLATSLRGDKVYLFWVNTTTNRYLDFMVMNNLDGTAIIARKTLGRLGTTQATHPMSLAVDGDGGTSDKLYLAYRNNSNDDIYFINSTDSGTTFPSKPLAIMVGTFVSPSIVYNGTNLYVSSSSTTETSFTNSTNSGISWRAIYSPYNPAGNQIESTLALNELSYPTMLMSSSQFNTNYDIVFGRWGGTSWGTLTYITNDTRGNRYPNAKMFYNSSKIEFLWRTGIAAPYNIVYDYIGFDGSPNVLGFPNIIPQYIFKPSVTINCSATYNGANNGRVEFVWYINGSLMDYNGSSADNIANLTRVYTNVSLPFARGYNITCAARAYNGSAYSSWVNSSTVTVSTTPPAITILSPLNQTYTQTWAWANVSLNDTGSWCGVSLNGTANQSLTNSTGKWWLNLSVPAEGLNNVKFYCNDTLGNMGNSSTVYFTIDVTVPAITIYSPENATTSDNTPLLNATEIEINPDRMWYKLDNGLNQTVCSGCTNFYGNLSNSSWYYSIWSYRRPIQINNPGTSNLTDYQVNLTVNFISDKMNADFSDLRFTYYNTTYSNETEIPYWIDTYTASTNTTVWIKVPIIANTTNSTVYMYYGNPSAAGYTGNGTATFDFFDDFDSFDSNKWTATGAYSVASSQITITTGCVYSDYTVASQSGFISEAKVKWNNFAGYSGLEIANSSSTAGSNSNSKKLVYLMTNSGGSASVTAWAANGTSASYNIISGGAQFTATAGTTYIIGHAVSSSQVIFYRNRITTNSYTGTWLAPFYLWLGYFTGSASGTTDISDIAVDWVLVRKYSSPQPAYSIGSEESSSDYPLADGSHTVIVYANDAADTVNSTNVTFTILTSANQPPLWRNQGQNTSTPGAGEAVSLYAEGYDDTGLDYAILETNETGIAENKSTYDSPQDMVHATAWTWSNFTWLNASTQGNTVVGWKIYYNDTTNKQNVTDSLSFTVQASTTITIVTNMVSFGDIASGETNDTADNAPLPFKVRNDGNININVSVSSSDNLWNAQSNPTNYFQAACNSSSEWTVTAGSVTSYTAIPTSNKVFCYNLPYLPSEDEAEVEINITAPAEEAGGAKSSIITFTGGPAS